MSDPSTRRPRALINGFGRIGRLAMRRALGAVGRAAGAAEADGDVPFDVVAVNDPNAAAESAAYLLQWDSVQGVFGEAVAAEDGNSFTVTVPGKAPMQVAFSKFSKPSEVSLGGVWCVEGGRVTGLRRDQGGGGCKKIMTLTLFFSPLRSPSPTSASTSCSSAPASF